MKRKRPQHQKGFTLVETLVAILIFMSSTTALIVVTGQSVSDVSMAKNKLTARALSEEGIEMVRNIRDSYWLSEATPGTGWTDFQTLIEPCVSINGCMISDPHDFFATGMVSSPPSIDPCNSPSGVTGDYPSGCFLLDRDALSEGYYDYGSATDVTPFQRTIKLSLIGGGSVPALKVNSTVAWRQGASIKTVSATEYLYNWH